MSAQGVGMDFFSWHQYTTSPSDVGAKAERMRAALDRHGYTETESILDEWNYVNGWTDKFQNTIDAIRGLKGAAFAAGVLSAGQDSPVDMLMYYDSQPSVFNGLFDIYTYAPTGTYYVFYAWSKLRRLGIQLETTVDEQDVRAVAATDGNGRTGILVSRFNDDNNVVTKKTVKVHARELRFSEVTVHVTDAAHLYTEVPAHIDGGDIELVLAPNSYAMLEFR